MISVLTGDQYLPVVTIIIAVDQPLAVFQSVHGNKYLQMHAPPGLLLHPSVLVSSPKSDIPVLPAHWPVRTH